MTKTRTRTRHRHQQEPLRRRHRGRSISGNLKITVYLAIFIVVFLVLLMAALIYKMVSDPDFAKNIVGDIEGGDTTSAAVSGSKGSAIARWWSRQDTTSRVVFGIFGVLIVALIVIFGVIPAIQRHIAEDKYDEIQKFVAIIDSPGVGEPTREEIEASDLSLRDWMQVIHDARVHMYKPPPKLGMENRRTATMEMDPKYRDFVANVLDIKGSGRYNNIIDVIKHYTPGSDPDAKIRAAVQNFVTHHGTNQVALDRLEKQLALTEHHIPEKGTQHRIDLIRVLRGLRPEEKV